MLLSNLNLLATAPGGVAKLRELILTLAVQGKLVPQDPKDEPASELLKRIRAEKDRLIAEGKIKRDKPLAEIAEEEKPFSVPQGWELCRLGDLLLSIRSGGTPSKQNPRYWDGDIPWASVKDLRFGEPVTDTQDRITQAGLDAGSELATAGSILICTRMGLGKIGEALVDVAINQDLKAVRLGTGIDKQYFINCFKTLALVGSGMTVAGIKQDELLGFAVPLPPEAEQIRIVTRVEELMRLCDALEAKGQLEATQHVQLVSTLLGTLTESETPEELTENWQRVTTHFDILLDRPEAVDALEQTILQLAVRGLLVPQDPQDEPAGELLKKIRAEKDRLIAEGKIKRDKPLPPIDEDEQPFEVPQGWECARLDELSIVVVDCPHSTAKFVSKGLLCIDTNSFKEGVLLPHKLRYVDEATFAERVARLQPAPGDLVFSREGSVGQSLIIPEGVVACLGQRVMLFRLSRNVSNEFVRLVITSKGFLDNLQTLHKGIGAKHVNVGDMRLAVVPVPPLAEQARIVNCVAQLRRLCADLRQRLADASERQSQLAQSHVEKQCTTV